MPRKLKNPHDDKEQSERFVEKAKEVARDDAVDAFERAFKKVSPPKKPRAPSVA